jgi:hypothetical protein
MRRGLGSDVTASAFSNIVDKSFWKEELTEFLRAWFRGTQCSRKAKFDLQTPLFMQIEEWCDIRGAER